jgi:hypothetical protein
LFGKELVRDGSLRKLWKEDYIWAQCALVEEKDLAAIQAQFAESYGLRKRQENPQNPLHSLHPHDGENR